VTPRGHAILRQYFIRIPESIEHHRQGFNFFPVLTPPNFNSPQDLPIPRRTRGPFDRNRGTRPTPAVFIIPNPVAHVKGGDSSVEFIVQSAGPLAQPN